MQLSPVLPVKFGTICRSNSGLADFINHNGALILQALHEVHGKAEWSVKAYIDEARVRVFVTETNPEIQELTSPAFGFTRSSIYATEASGFTS